jgi:hypothetical protein
MILIQIMVQAARITGGQNSAPLWLALGDFDCIAVD